MGTALEAPADLFEAPIEEPTAVAIARPSSNSPATQGQAFVQAPITNPMAALSVEAQRAIAETQVSVFTAKQFPRDFDPIIKRIRSMCERRSLAAIAEYSFSRGGEEISGPSVYLLKAIAQQWGNIEYGVTELSRKSAAPGQKGESVVMAYAWDMETGTREKRVFTVAHHRDTRNGGYALKDERDIYELIANMGSRRLRACLEGVIPLDVIEIAVEECTETLKKMNLTTPQMIAKALAGCESLGITRERIEAKWQRRMESASPAHMIRLSKTLQAIRDGMTTADEAFPPTDDERAAGTSSNASAAAANVAAAPAATGNEGLRERLKKNKTASDSTREPGEEG